MRNRILASALYFVGLVLSIPHSHPRAQPVAGTYPDSCPYGRIAAAPENCCGAECTFSGSVDGWFPKVKPIVKWEVSGGKIVSGQGTWSIKVEADEARDMPITVTLRVTGKGLPKPCEVEVTYVAAVCPKGCGH